MADQNVRGIMFLSPNEIIVVLQNDEDYIYEAIGEMKDNARQANWAFVYYLIQLGALTYEEGFQYVKATDNEWMQWFDAE